MSKTTNKKIVITCHLCGKETSIKRYRKSRARLNFCSSYCHNKYQSINRKSTDMVLLRNSDEYRAWRKLIFERDSYTCKMCGEIARQIQAHHIFPVRDYPDLTLDINNGITLCVICHKKINRKEYEFIPTLLKNIK